MVVVMRTERSLWDKSRWRIRKVGETDVRNVKEDCAADTISGVRDPDPSDQLS